MSFWLLLLWLLFSYSVFMMIKLLTERFHFNFCLVSVSPFHAWIVCARWIQLRFEYNLNSFCTIFFYFHTPGFWMIMILFLFFYIFPLLRSVSLFIIFVGMYALNGFLCNAFLLLWSLHMKTLCFVNLFKAFNFFFCGNETFLFQILHRFTPQFLNNNNQSHKHKNNKSLSFVPFTLKFFQNLIEL